MVGLAHNGMWLLTTARLAQGGAWPHHNQADRPWDTALAVGCTASVPAERELSGLRQTGRQACDHSMATPAGLIIFPVTWKWSLVELPRPTPHPVSRA